MPSRSCVYFRQITCSHVTTTTYTEEINVFLLLYLNSYGLPVWFDNSMQTHLFLLLVITCFDICLPIEFVALDIGSLF